MSTIEQLEAAIDALGRPRSVFAPLPTLHANIKAKAAWDAANPEKRETHFRLVGELSELQAEVDAANQERRAAERALERLEASGAGERSIGALSALKSTPSLNAVESWLSGDASWLLLIGAKGCGKTVAATFAVYDALRDGRSAAFRRVSEVGKLSGFDAGAQEMARLKRVKLLVLDELGVEFSSEYAKSQFHELLDVRHEARLRTVLTSNLPLEEVKKRLGERLIDRIRGDGSVFEFAGKSLRGAP